MSLTITNVHNQSKWVVLPILKFEVSYLDEGRASDCVTWLVMMSWLFWLGLKLKFSNFKIIQNFESWMHEDNDDDDEEYICRICLLLLAPSRKTTHRLHEDAPRHCHSHHHPTTQWLLLVLVSWLSLQLTYFYTGSRYCFLSSFWYHKLCQCR